MKKIFLLLLLLISTNIYAADTSKLKKDASEALENYNNGNFQSAAESFSDLYYEMKNISYKDISARFRLAYYAALSYQGMKDYTHSLAWFETCIALQKKLPSIYNLSTLEAHKADTLHKLDRTDEALSTYEKILHQNNLTDNDTAVILYQIANIYATSKNDLIQATNFCSKLKLNDNIKEHKTLTARCELINGKYFESKQEIEKAEDSFNKIMKISSEMNLNLQAYLHLATLYERTNNYTKARESYENALFLIIENGITEDIYSIGDKIKALLTPSDKELIPQANRMRYLASLEFVDDSYRAVLYRLSSIYYKISGDMNNLYPTAEEGEGFLRDLKANIKHKEEYRMELGFYIAYALTEIGAYEDALEIAIQLKNFPAFKKIKDFNFQLEEVLAINYFKLDNIQKAREHINKAKKLFPKDATKDQIKHFEESLKLIG